MIGFGRDVLRQFRDKLRRGEGFDLSLEEVIAGGVGGQCGLAILPDVHLFQS